MSLPTNGPMFTKTDQKKRLLILECLQEYSLPSTNIDSSLICLLIIYTGRPPQPPSPTPRSNKTCELKYEIRGVHLQYFKIILMIGKENLLSPSKNKIGQSRR